MTDERIQQAGAGQPRNSQEVIGRVVSVSRLDEADASRTLTVQGVDGQEHRFRVPDATLRQAGPLWRSEAVRVMADPATRQVAQVNRVSEHFHPGLAASRGRFGLEAYAQERQLPLRDAPDVAGAMYRGRLEGYAVEPNGARYAVLNTGRELMAVPTEQRNLTPGREVRVTAQLAPDSPALAWRLSSLHQREPALEQAR